LATLIDDAQGMAAVSMTVYAGAKMANDAILNNELAPLQLREGLLENRKQLDTQIRNNWEFLRLLGWTEQNIKTAHDAGYSKLLKMWNNR
jgi:hypothetical protein